jgi:hypothetical protein
VRRITRRRWVASAAGAASLAILKTPAAYAQQGTPIASPIPAGRDWRRESWVGSWAAGVHVARPGVGEEPVTIGAARGALRDGDEGIDQASDRQVTFSGLPSITIPDLPFFGPSALARFDREVLAMPGVSRLILFRGDQRHRPVGNV